MSGGVVRWLTDGARPARLVGEVRPQPTAHTSVDLAAEPWRALCPVGARQLWNPSARALRRTPAGEDVVLVCDRPLSRRRLRRTARRANLTVSRELIVLPRVASAMVVLDETETSVRHFWSSVATVPPGLTRSTLAATIALRVARRLPWTWTGAMAPGHVVVGRRS